MTDAQIVMLFIGIFYAAVAIGLIFIEVHLIRILISLRPENCEKCTGLFKEKSVHRGWFRGDEYDFFRYKYTYKVNGMEYEFEGEKLFAVKEEKQEEYKDDDYAQAIIRKKEEEPDRYALSETIEVLYNEKYPKRAYSRDVDNRQNPWYNKVFIGIVAFCIVVCLVFAAYSFIDVFVL